MLRRRAEGFRWLGVAVVMVLMTAAGSSVAGGATTTAGGERAPRPLKVAMEVPRRLQRAKETVQSHESSLHSPIQRT